MMVFSQSDHVPNAIKNGILQITAGVVSIIFGKYPTSPLTGVYSGSACIISGVFMLGAVLLQRCGKAKVSWVVAILICLIIAINVSIYNLGASMRQIQENIIISKTRPDTRPPVADGWAVAFSHFSTRA